MKINKYIVFTTIFLVALSVVSAFNYNNIGNLTEHYETNIYSTNDNEYHQIINFNFLKINIGQNIIISLDETPFKSYSKDSQDNILDKIRNGLSLQGINSSKSFDDRGIGFIKLQTENIKEGSYSWKIKNIAQTATGGQIIDYDCEINGEISKIKTNIFINPKNTDINNINSKNDILEVTLVGLDFVDGITHYTEEGISNSEVNIRLINEDNFMDPVDISKSYTTDHNGKITIHLKDFESLINGRPGKYELIASLNNNNKYFDISKSINLINPDYYKIEGINNTGSSDDITIFKFFTNKSSIDKNIQFKVTDYYNKSVINKSIEFKSSSNYNKLITDENGIVNFIYRNTFDGEKSFDILDLNVSLEEPEQYGNYRSNTLYSSIKSDRYGDITKSICLRTQGKGTVFDTKTFYAPNGMSITAKGGLFGAIAQYDIKFYDKDKNLINESKENYYESGASDRRIYIPENAVYMKIKVGCTSTGKVKPETDFIKTGNGIIFWEGAVGTENTHIAIQNPNGYEILREDYKC